MGSWHRGPVLRNLNATPPHKHKPRAKSNQASPRVPRTRPNIDVFSGAILSGHACWAAPKATRCIPPLAPAPKRGFLEIGGQRSAWTTMNSEVDCPARFNYGRGNSQHRGRCLHQRLPRARPAVSHIAGATKSEAIDGPSFANFDISDGLRKNLNGTDPTLV